MKFLGIIFLILMLQIPGENNRLTISISGLKPLKGDLYISLHNRPEYFQVADSALMKKKITVNEETESVVFDNVPQGKYAIAIYHDENLNGILDLNEMGFPKEGYGFSTKNKVIGRPNFGQAAFELGGNDTIEIKMIYHTVPNQNKDTQNK